MEEMDTLRVVLLGRDGSGKSSLGNTIFGNKQIFTVHTFHVRQCSKNHWLNFAKQVNGRKIQLTDTTGYFDIDFPLRCIEESAPGPHAFLLVLRVDKFTCQEQAVRDGILECFSKEVLKYTTVVFTHGDDLPKGMRVEEWVEQDEALKILVKECGGRVHVFDNKYWNNSQDLYRNNQNQVEQLLQTIDQTVRENGGGYFTNDMLQEIENQINDEGKAPIHQLQQQQHYAVG